MLTSKNKISKFLKNQIIETFSQVVVELDNKSESLLFLKDFFSESELETFSKRFAVIYWIKKRKTNENIRTNLKVSNETIKNAILLMKKRGVILGIKKIEAEEWANKWADKFHKIISK